VTARAWLLGGTALALGLTVCLLVFTALCDQGGPVRRLWNLYVEYLNRKLKRLLLRPYGPRIAMGQLAALALLGAAWISLPSPAREMLGAVVVLGPALYLERRRHKRVAEIEKQLDGFLLALSNALKSIPSVSAAFSSVVESSQPPMREEIELANREMRVGSTLEEALVHMAERVGSARLDSALSAVVIGRQLGGNLTRVLENTAGSIREINRLHGVLRMKTSEAKMQLWVIGLAPFVLVVALSLVSPGYFDPLHENATGYAVGLGAIGAWLVALYTARKVLAVSL
jgi:tight adherence protein B